tara:strand:+ start:299 stop:793 length:495 start_codon:yes stop_codon:yes gene_type:complete
MKIDKVIVEFMKNPLPETIEDAYEFIECTVPEVELKDYEKCIKLIHKWRCKRKDYLNLLNHYENLLNQKIILRHHELIGGDDSFSDNLLKGYRYGDPRYRQIQEDLENAFPEYYLWQEYSGICNIIRNYRKWTSASSRLAEKWKNYNDPRELYSHNVHDAYTLA